MTTLVPIQAYECPMTDGLVHPSDCEMCEYDRGADGMWQHCGYPDPGDVEIDREISRRLGK